MPDGWRRAFGWVERRSGVVAGEPRSVCRTAGRLLGGRQRAANRKRKRIAVGMPDWESEEDGVAESRRAKLLTPLQAAVHLGITPELLFAYTAGRARAKRRRLATEEVDGETRFDPAVLDDFDRYLREPWAPEGADRPKVPACVENHLRAESGNQCARCGTGSAVDTAHIDAWTESRSHHHHNLIRLCKGCHAEFDVHGSLPLEEVRKKKREAIARTREALQKRLSPIAARFVPPLPEGVLEGRADEVESLRDALRTSRMVLIHGPGGIGKTQLLAHALARVETRRRVVWLEVEQAASAEGMVAALEVLLSDGSERATRATLPKRLDALPACVVLDGVEQVNGPAIDAVDDLLDELKNSTVQTQFVVTSQVDLLRTVFDERRYVEGLVPETSRRLLRSALRAETHIDADSESWLVEFADGHPLTLRLAAKLADYLGSGQAAVVQIERLGTAVVAIQKRTTHDRQTSLDRCLGLAYGMLGAEEQRLLYLIASCPGGILSRQLELEDHGGGDAPLLLAALRRWSLVETKEKGEWAERSRMLSPIRAYVRQRWGEEHEEEARVAVRTLVVNFAAMAAAVAINTGTARDVPKMLSLFSRELPNLLLVVDEAEADEGNVEFRVLASTICSALMRFFFVLRLPEQGSNLMRRGARIALRDGDWKRASGHIAMMVALAQRSEDMSVLGEAEGMLEELCAEDAESRGNVALTYAMLASCRGDHQATERHARETIEQFVAVRGELTPPFGDADEQDGLEENSNDLSGAYHKLGDALLDQYRVTEACTAYEKALGLVCGDGVAVNEGQILHQIGNCLSHMGDHAGAAEVYGRASALFHQVSMREYLSNALAGWGYAMLAIAEGVSPPGNISTAVFADGLGDVAEEVASRFADPVGRNQQACGLAVSKLFGVTVALSFSDVALKLGPVAKALSNQMGVSRAEADGRRDAEEAERYVWDQLKSLLTLMSSIAAFETRVVERGSVRKDDTMALLESCGFQVMWAGSRVYAWDWLDVYLRRKWSVE